MPFAVHATGGAFATAQDMLTRARERRARGEWSRAVFDATVAAEIASSITPDPETLYQSLACVGRLHMSCGEWDKAGGWYAQALDAALTHKLGAWIGPAHHDMMLVAQEVGERRQFERHAERAMAAYAGHRRLTAFVADLSLCNRPAHDRLRLWRPVVAFGNERDKRYGRINVLCCYTEMGDADRAVRMWKEIQAEAWIADEGVSLALTVAAENLAAISLDLAKDAARSALNIATERAEDTVAERARALL